MLCHCLEFGKFLRLLWLGSWRACFALLFRAPLQQKPWEHSEGWHNDEHMMLHTEQLIKLCILYECCPTAISFASCACRAGVDQQQTAHSNDACVQMFHKRQPASCACNFDAFTQQSAQQSTHAGICISIQKTAKKSFACNIDVISTCTAKTFWRSLQVSPKHAAKQAEAATISPADAGNSSQSAVNDVQCEASPALLQVYTACQAQFPIDQQILQKP